MNSPKEAEHSSSDSYLNYPGRISEAKNGANPPRGSRFEQSLEVSFNRTEAFAFEAGRYDCAVSFPSQVEIFGPTLQHLKSKVAHPSTGKSRKISLLEIRAVGFGLAFDLAKNATF